MGHLCLMALGVITEKWMDGDSHSPAHEPSLFDRGWVALGVTLKGKRCCKLPAMLAQARASALGIL